MNSLKKRSADRTTGFYKADSSGSAKERQWERERERGGLGGTFSFRTCIFSVIFFFIFFFCRQGGKAVASCGYCPTAHYIWLCLSLYGCVCVWVCVRVTCECAGVCVGDRVLLRLINSFARAVRAALRTSHPRQVMMMSTPSPPAATVTGRKLQDTIKSANKIASEWQQELQGKKRARNWRQLENVCECKRCRKYSTINKKRNQVGGWTGSEGRGCREETSVSMNVSKCKQRWRKKQNKRVEIVEIE